MARCRNRSLLLALVAFALAPATALATESDTTAAHGAVDGDSTAAVDAESTSLGPDTVSSPDDDHDGLTYLVPELEGSSYRVTNDTQKYKTRISFSPGIGKLGNQDLFMVRLGFAPNTWLGYEIALGHNPTPSVHAVLHTFNIILHYPLPWRAQPYVSLGYGMMTVFPGQAINADPVRKNTLTAGGGLEFYIRDDLAIRGELLGTTVLGQELNSEGTVAYQYREYTIGFTFYRSLGQ